MIYCTQQEKPGSGPSNRPLFSLVLLAIHLAAAQASGYGPQLFNIAQASLLREKVQQALTCAFLTLGLVSDVADLSLPSLVPGNYFSACASYRACNDTDQSRQGSY